MYLDAFIDSNTTIEISEHCVKLINLDKAWQINLFTPNDLVPGKDWAFMAAIFQQLATLCGQRADS
jgi:hypothetical protein